MISVIQALQTVLNSAQDLGFEEIPFLKSVGRILKEAIFADRDFPPFNRVSMDGIVIDYNSFKNGQKSFKIEGIQAAGSAQIALKDSKNCIEVMTGAVAPKNANTVVRYEDVTIENGIATLNIDGVSEGQNIHPKGKDGKQWGACFNTWKTNCWECSPTFWKVGGSEWTPTFWKIVLCHFFFCES